MDATSKISVVIPVYESATSLPILLGRLTSVLGCLGRDYEIICVDDCSKDESWSVLLELKQRYEERIRIVQLLVNSGQHNAILCGFSLVTGDVVVTMDDDLQNPPEEIPKLVAAVDDGYDLVIGAYDSKKHTRFRNWSGGGIDWLLRRIFDLPRDFQLTSFRAVRRSAIDQVNEMGGLFPYVTAMLLANASKRKNVPVEHHARLAGRSNYTMSRSLSLAANLILSYSSYPVFFVAGICLLSMLLFAASGVLTIYLFLTQGSSVPGWTSLVVVMSFFNSLTLLCLFVFAIYLARFHHQLTRTRTGYRIGRILMSRKTLLVLAASRYQLETIQTARRLGYRVVTTDNVPSNPGHALADRAYAIDITDREGVLRIAAEERVAGVIAAATDVGVPTRAYVTERLGLPGPSPRVAQTVCDKVRMRSFLRQHGLPVPEVHLVAPGRHLDSALLGDGWWVLKPDCSSGAKGMRIVDSAAGYREHLPEALEFSPTGTVLLERFVHGHQGTIEGVIRDGEIVRSYFLDRQTVPPPFVTTAGHRMPTCLPVPLQRELLRQVGLIWRVLGVREGPFDCDFVATEQEAYVLDLSPRLGGNSIAHLLRQAADFDILTYAIREASGDPIDLPRAADLTPTGLVLLWVDREGRLDYDEAEVAGLASEPWVAHLELDVPRGHPVRPFVNSRHRVGEAIVVGATREEVDARVAELERRLALRAC